VTYRKDPGANFSSPLPRLPGRANPIAITRIIADRGQGQSRGGRGMVARRRSSGGNAADITTSGSDIRARCRLRASRQTVKPTKLLPSPDGPRSRAAITVSPKLVADEQP
jgi:hypothetical protein